MYPLEVTLQLRSVLLSTNRRAIISTLANYNRTQQSHTGLCINICTYKHSPKHIPSFPQVNNLKYLTLHLLRKQKSNASFIICKTSFFKNLNAKQNKKRIHKCILILLFLIICHSDPSISYLTISLLVVVTATLWQEQVANKWKK